MRNTGLFLLFSAFVAGAYLTALDPKEVPWMWFAPTMVLGVLGLGILHRGSRAATRATHVLAGDQSILTQSVAALLEQLSRVREQFDANRLQAVRNAIDSGMRGEITRFVEARESMIHLYGMQTYADIMSDFAAGERYLNRVWSASTDAYANEARSYLDKADAQFSSAQRRLADAAQ